MIIKSSQRAGHKELASHLLRERDLDGQKQRITVSGNRDLVMGNNVVEALDDMALLAQASARCEKHLYHISMSPSKEMTDEDWTAAFEAYEKEFGLTHLPYIEVTHAKGDRPAHKHRVYERVDTETGTAIQLSHTKIRNEKVARLIEYELGHTLTIGKHNRAVMKQLQKEGRGEITAWMQQGHAHDVERPVAFMDYQEHQQERRTGISKTEVKAILQEAWESTENGQAFEQALIAQNLLLARGDRRDFVVVDAQGGTHSPRRLLRIKAKILREKWSDLIPEHLPTVGQIQQEQNSQDVPSVDLADPEQAKRQLEDSIAEMDAEIAELEAYLNTLEQVHNTATEDLATEEPATAVLESITQPLEQTYSRESLTQAEEENVREDTLIEDAYDQRELMEWYWQQHAEANAGRRKPQGSAIAEDSWGLAPKTIEALTLQGRAAIEERNRRLANLAQSSEQNGEALKSINQGKIVSQNDDGIPAYHEAWQARFGRLAIHIAASRELYRTADRWIVQRLANRGYTRIQARRILARASPEVLNQRPSERLTYIRRIVDRVYTPYEQKQQIKSPDNKKETPHTNAVSFRNVAKHQQNQPPVAEQEQKQKRNKDISRKADNRRKKQLPKQHELDKDIEI